MSKITLTDLVNLENQTTAVNAINTNNTIVELAIDNTISRDGTNPNQMGANLDMNSHKIINLPAPLSATEPVRLGDIDAEFIGTPPGPVVDPSSGNASGPGFEGENALVWTNANVRFNNNVIEQISTDPSAVALITLGGTATVGDRINLRFVYGSNDITVGYTIVTGDSYANGRIMNGLVTAIANNTSLFNLNGAVVVGGVVTPSAGQTWGGYDTGAQIGFIVTTSSQAFAFDWNSQASMQMSYTVVGSGTETVTMVGAAGQFFNNTPALGGSTAGVLYQLPNAYDNNPAYITGRFVDGVPPPKGSLAFAMYTTSSQSATPNQRTANYGIFSNWIEDSTTGNLKSNWLLQNPQGGGTWFGAGVFSNYGGAPFSGGATIVDKGPGTFNAGSSYWLNNVHSIDNAGGQFRILSGNTDPVVFGASGGVGINTTPTGNTFTSGLGTFVTGAQTPTTGAGLSLTSSGSATSILSKNYAASTIPLVIQGAGITLTDTANGNIDVKIGVSNVASGQLTIAGSSGGAVVLKPTATASGTLSLPSATDTLVGKTTIDTFTNKTLDTAGTGNSFSINGVAVTANTGTGAVVRENTPTLVTPVLGVSTATSINKVVITTPASSATLTIPNGVTLTGPATSGTAATLENTETFTGVKTFNTSKLVLAGSVSGGTVLNAGTTPASNTITLPTATDTLVGKATADTFTNKTYDTAGAGNSFSINGLAATTNTGTGAVVRAASPTFSGSITAAAMTMSGQLNVAYASPNFSLIDTGTSFSYFQIQNAGGTNQIRVGSEGASGGALFTGSSGLAGVIGTTVSQPFQIFTNNTLRGTFQAGGGFSLGTATDPGSGSFVASGSVKSLSASAGIGYATGSGGTVTQASNRNTGVTLNTVSGAITLVSALNAAVSGATANSFTVTNSSVAAADTITVSQKSGTDKYLIFVTTVAAGSFVLTFYTTGGTSTEQPVFTFNVIKGVTS